VKKGRSYCCGGDVKEWGEKEEEPTFRICKVVLEVRSLITESWDVARNGGQGGVRGKVGRKLKGGMGGDLG